MPPLRMQPTFRLEVPGRVDDVLEKLRRAIETPGLAGLAKSAGPCLDFRIEPADCRFWSPHLEVQLRELPDRNADADRDGRPRTELHGRFSPRPEVWTMVMMAYFSAACAAFFALMFGYAQWSLGWRPWALAIVPVCAATIAALHTASLIGQRLSADQMALLRQRFDRACEIAFGGEGG